MKPHFAYMDKCGSNFSFHYNQSNNKALKRYTGTTP